jgi:Ricin-type beta-trefoil lectin domain/Putative Ig domain
MGIRAGFGRAVIFTASLLAFASVIAVQPARAANIITFTTVPPNQTINPLPGTVALTATATDSDTTATVTYSAANLPPGVVINATNGAITGSATTAFTGTTTLTATDGTATGTAMFTWTDANTITINNPGPQATMPGAAISMQLTYSDNGGLVPTFTAAGLPTGLGISAAGVISGTPTTPGTYTPTITATDSTGSAGTASFTWTITADKIKVTPIANQTSAPNTAVTLQVTATDSDTAEPLTYSAGVTSTLPPGIVINTATGAITGKATAIGTFPVTITVSDPTGATQATSFTWTISADTITVKAPANQSSPPNTAVTLQINAADSDPTEVLAYSAGTPSTLPPGLTINAATGLISGKTTAATGTYTVTITVTNAVSTPATVTFTWAVARNKITVTAPKIVQSLVGVVQTPPVITAVDARAREVLTFSAAGLPAGLKINPVTGRITGTPRALTTVTVTITATDPSGSAGSAAIRWQVGGLIGIVDPGTQILSLGQNVYIPLKVTDTAAGDKVTLSAAGLPRGVSFQARPPLLTGWPLFSRTYNVAITARGLDGGVTVLRFPVRVRGAVTTPPGGPVALGFGNLCLTDPGNRTANGTRVQLAGCNGGTTQHWLVASDGTVRVHGRCLAAFGTRIALWPCTGSAAETWVKGTDGELIIASSGECLADPGSSTRNGTLPTLARCTTARNERWAAPGAPMFAGIMNKCADDQVSSPANGNIIDSFACNYSIAQSWRFLPDGTIRTIGSCLTVRGAAGRVGALIELWGCQPGNARQHWRVVRIGGFVVEIQNGSACLAVPSHSSPDGTQLRLTRCTGTGAVTEWHD